MADRCTCYECVRHGCPCATDDAIAKELAAWKRNSGFDDADALRRYLSGLTVLESDELHMRVWDERLAAAVARAEQAEAKISAAVAIAETAEAVTWRELHSRNEDEAAGRNAVGAAILEVLK